MSIDLDEISFTDEDGALRGHVQIYGTTHHIILVAVAWDDGSGIHPKVRIDENDVDPDYHIQVAANDDYEFDIQARRVSDDSTGHFETVWHEGVEYVLFIQPQVS